MRLLQVEGLGLEVRTGHVLQKRKRILHDICFEVSKGTVTAYLGPNGAGKTSTFRVLCGLCRPASGRILFDGKEHNRGLPHARFGFMPEQPYFYRNLSPRLFLKGMGRLSGMSNTALNNGIAMWARQLHFDDVLDQPLSACSKGQVQRVGLAQALQHQPDLLVLDEPMSGLDPLGRDCVRQVIAREIERGATVLFSSHILADVEALCDQAIVLSAGQVVYSGGIGELMMSKEEWQIRFFWSGHEEPDVDGITMRREPDGSWLAQCPDEKSRDAALASIMANSEARLFMVAPVRQTLEEAFVGLVKSAGNTNA